MPPRSKPVVVGTAGVQKKKFRPSHKNLPDGPWKRKLEKEKKNFVQSIKTKRQYAKIKAQVETEIPMRVIRDIDQAETKTKTKANQISKNTHEVELDGSDDNVADEDLDEESFDEALTSGSDEQDDEAMEGLDSTVDSKEDVSANEEDEEEETEEIHKPTKVLNDDPNDTTHPSRKHTKANPARPGYFDKQLKKAEEKKRVIEERKAAIEAKKEERDNAILARQKRRQDFGRALNGGDRGGFGGRGRGNLGGRGGGRGGRGGFSGRGGFGGRGGRRDNVGADGKRKLGRESEFLLEKVKRMVGGGH